MDKCTQFFECGIYGKHNQIIKVNQLIKLANKSTEFV